MNPCARSWSRQRRSAYASSIEALKNYLNKLAGEREVVPHAQDDRSDQVPREAPGADEKRKHSRPGRSRANRALGSRHRRLSPAPLTDRLIVVNGLKGKGIRKEILQRMQSDWQVTNPVDPRHAAVAGAIGTGAAGGLATDLASGGLTLGLGTLIGTVVGALGGAGASDRLQPSEGGLRHHRHLV